MRGQALPGFMMGTASDPGQVMGSLFADAPGPRVSAARATQVGSQVPAGATLDRAANTITFTGTSVRPVDAQGDSHYLALWSATTALCGAPRSAVMRLSYSPSNYLS
jgi:hypothetical protein